MKDNFELYMIAKEKMYQTEGLVATLFLIASIMLLASFNPFASFLNFLVLVGIVGLLISGWLYIRRVPTFGKNDIGILFAPHGDKAVCEDIERLREELQNRIKSSPYCKRFVLKTLPPNQVISDADTAIMIRRKSRCLLLIWGRYEKGQLQRQELRGFLAGRLNFTYPYPSQFDAEFISKDMKVGVVDRKWMFKSENELIERDFVISNIYDVARYIIGTCLLYFGYVKDGKEILFDIITNPSQAAWAGNAGTSVRSFLENIRTKISWCDAKLAHDIYTRDIFINGKLNYDAEKLSQIVTLADASLKNKPNSDAYTVKAIAHFLLGDIKKAKKTMSELRRREPVNPSPCYSLGFLFAYEGNLNKAEHYYLKGFEATKNATPEYIFHLSEFIEAVLEHVDVGNHFHLHYVLGLIHKELIDSQSAKAHFEKYLTFVSNHPEMEEWSEKARKHLSDIS